MNRIDLLFKKLKASRKKAFIVYLTAGYPDLKATEKLVLGLEKNGVDMVELGIPFSDPLADGPTIQKASERAISKGANVKAIFSIVRSIRKKSKLPIAFMTYYNIVLHYGIRRFVKDSKACGVDGIIVPDLPPEEGKELIAISRKNDFSTIFLAAPTSTKERLKFIAKESRGFIYYVSLTGVTGVRERLPKDILANVKALKRITTKPISVGFGVSNASQARTISLLADGVIVGSALIKVIEENIGKPNLHKKVSSFTKMMARAIHG